MLISSVVDPFNLLTMRKKCHEKSVGLKSVGKCTKRCDKYQKECLEYQIILVSIMPGTLNILMSDESLVFTFFMYCIII